jgi:uncharacterized protein (TIGR02246 family)
MTFCHVGIVVADYDAAYEFYTEVLGLKEAYTVERNGQPLLTYLQLNRETFVEIIPARPGQATGITHFGMEVADIDATVADLRTHGLTVDDPGVTPANARFLRIRDADDVEIEVMEYGPESSQYRAMRDWESVQEPDAVQRSLDHAAINNLIARYVRALDTRDADLYAGVFTEDAVFDVNGDVRNGRDEIRAIVVGLQQSRASQPEGAPRTELYHAVINSEIDIIDADSAHHRGYWQTISVAPDGAIRIGAMGIYDDQLVKVEGQWLIANRKLTNFVQ